MPLVDEITPRIVVYSVGTTPSTGPFNIPFPFYDTDEVGVYVNGVRTTAVQFTVPVDLSLEAATVELEVAVSSSEVSIVSETGLVRTTSDNFVQTELSRELDRLFALFQEDRQLGVRIGPDKASIIVGTQLAGAAGGKVLMFSEDGLQLEAGPTGTDIQDAQENAASAAASAMAAAGSATDAAASATSAAVSEDNAAASATAAAASETAAAGSEGAAASSAAAAAVSETNAAGSASAAATSASDAATSETNAASFATAAATSETNAANSAATANTAATAAAASFDSFDDRYLGAKAADPTLDNDGAALVTGALYFNTVENVMKVYTGSVWSSVSVSVASQAEAEAGAENTKMMTPLRVRNALNASGSAPTYACRAWVYFDGTGTPAIQASGNVSSITDNGTGDYTINFTTAMPDANYVVVALANNVVIEDVGTRTTSACRTQGAAYGGSASDSTRTNVAVFR